jgi:hypothetical protein
MLTGYFKKKSSALQFCRYSFLYNLNLTEQADGEDSNEEGNNGNDDNSNEQGI